MATLKSKNAILARKRISDLLEENGGSWKAVEKKTGISRGTLYHIYRGDRHPSNHDCAALGLPKQPRRTYDISYKRLRDVLQADMYNTE